MLADLKLIAWVFGTSVLLAVLVPDFSHGAISVVVIQLVVPLVVAGPVAYAVVSGELKILNAAALVLAGVIVHSGASALLYRVAAGYAPFHDGVTVPVLWASFALKALAVFVVLLSGLAFRWLKQRGQGAS